MNSRLSVIDRAVKNCVTPEAKRNVRNALRQLHFLEDVLQSNRSGLALQSRQQIVQAYQGDLPGTIQTQALVLEGLLGHLRAWLNEEVTLALEAVTDAKHGYRAVALIEKESHCVSEVQKSIINRAKAQAEAESSKRDKNSAAKSSRGGRGRSSGRGSYPSYNNNSERSFKPMRCILCSRNGHTADFCRYKGDKRDPKGPAGAKGGVTTG